MSKPAVKPIPDGMHSLTPHLTCAGAADAIKFYAKAFNAVELARLPGPQGKLMHAMLQIGDSALMLVDENPEWGMLGPKSLKGSPVVIHLFVENVDATVEQAVAAGANGHHARRGYVLGRSVWAAGGPVRAPLVGGDAHARPKPEEDSSGDGQQRGGCDR